MVLFESANPTALHSLFSLLPLSSSPLLLPCFSSVITAVLQRDMPATLIIAPGEREREKERERDGERERERDGERERTQTDRVSCSRTLRLMLKNLTFYSTADGNGSQIMES